MRQAFRTQKKLEDRNYETTLENASLKKKLAEYAEVVRNARALADEASRSAFRREGSSPTRLRGSEALKTLEARRGRRNIHAERRRCPRLDSTDVPAQSMLLPCLAFRRGH